MKLLSFRRPDGTESWGILKNEGVDRPRQPNAWPEARALGDDIPGRGSRAPRRFQVGRRHLAAADPEPGQDLVRRPELHKPHQGRRARTATEADHLYALPEFPGRSRPANGAAERVTHLRLRGRARRDHRPPLPPRK